MPGRPRRTMHQSWPGVRRRRVSQPSIHLPRAVYLPSMKTGFDSLSRFSLGAKNSSLAASARPPSRSAARSTRLREIVHAARPAQNSSRRQSGELSTIEYFAAAQEMWSRPLPPALVPRTASLCGDDAIRVASTRNLASGFQITKSASQPTAIAPFALLRAPPAARARAQSHSAKSRTQNSRERAPPSTRPEGRVAAKRRRPTREGNRPRQAASSPAGRASDPWRSYRLCHLPARPRASRDFRARGWAART